MAREGLGKGYKCIFANDISQKKAESYRLNHHPGLEFTLSDITRLTVDELPSGGHLAWSSFPCQDISLAGKGRGLKGERSGTFWKFWKLLQSLNKKEIIPVIALENVVGLLTSNKGDDFQVLVKALVQGGYRVGSLVIDAQRFLPQSRPRLFIIAVHNSVEIPVELNRTFPDDVWHNDAILSQYKRFESKVRESWIWWELPLPRVRVKHLSEIIEDGDPVDVVWHTQKETKKLLSSMSDTNKKKVKTAQKSGKLTVGAVYKRTRKNEKGEKVVRAEVRFDGVAGCLRTPAGGSSRQILMMVKNEKIRSRLFSSKESARLMGLSDGYTLPECYSYNDSLHLLGDGVAVPVVSWLEKHIFRKVLAGINSRKYILRK